MGNESLEDNPCVRVEFESANGIVRRLTGDEAQRWLKEVNGILAQHSMRYGYTGGEYAWEIDGKDA